MDAQVAMTEGFARAELHPPRVKDVRRFLVLIEEGYSVKRAAEAVGRLREEFAWLLETDEGFRAAYEQAYEASADILEDEAWRRSYERGRYRLGSDRLLELGLKARRPERYADKTQITGARGGPIKTVTLHVDHAEVLDVLAAAGLIAPALQRGDGEAA